MSSTTRRHWFAGSGNDYTASLSGSNLAIVARPEARLWVWDASEGGNRITDLLNESLVEIDELISEADGTIPRFQARVGDTQVWIGAAEGGPRTLMLATDLDEDMATVEETVSEISVVPGETANGQLFLGYYTNFAELPAEAEDGNFAIVIVS